MEIAVHVYVFYIFLFYIIVHADIYVMLITSHPVKYAAILMKQRGEKRSGHELDFTDLI